MKFVRALTVRGSLYRVTQNWWCRGDREVFKVPASPSIPTAIVPGGKGKAFAGTMRHWHSTGSSLQETTIHSGYPKDKR
jgi:hypothetical protein